MRGLAPGFRALRLARDDVETRRLIGIYVDTKTHQLFASYVVTQFDGTERLALHNLNTGLHLQVIRVDEADPARGPALKEWETNIIAVQLRLGLATDLQPVGWAFRILLDGSVETPNHKHLIQSGSIGTFGDYKGSWFAYTCRSVDGKPAEEFYLATVRDQAGRMVPDACAAVREQGSAAVGAKAIVNFEYFVTEDDRVLTFIDDAPVVVVDPGLDGHDIRVDGGVLVVSKAVVGDILREHGEHEEWNDLTKEEISRHVLERACRTGPRP